MANEPTAAGREKGTTYGGPCARTACQKPGATYWNSSTRAYYCAECARKINEHAAGLCLRVSAPVGDDPPERPPLLHLAGAATPCCGGWVLMLVGEGYKCPCGRSHNAAANRIIRAMEDRHVFG